ncbi:MAG TPA: TetR/AcrR family transcriptional regulator [Thermoanaerobaculia bacterium]|nr:TetR/AcrR family transcriptional regulator [Thermoanaerobaculia bacterium]
MSTTAAKDPCRGYHHGDLRRCLVEAARDLLAERGVTGFSLREIARRAGVSPRAPYHHFPDRTALLREVARMGFEELARRMAAHMEDEDPASRLEALGEEYLRFALECRAEFQTMHCDELCDAKNFPDRQDFADRPFVYLLRTLEEIAGKPVPQEELERYGLVAWSLVHGLVTLRAEGVLGASFPDEPIEPMMKDAVRRTTELIVAALRR